MSKKTVSDEELVAAMLSGKSIGEIAASVNLSPRGLYRRRESPTFQKLYAEAKAEIYRAAAAGAISRIGDAVNVLTETMVNESVSPAVRVNAADCVIRQSLRLIDAADFDERLTKLERQIDNR